jgi:Ankyrin repeats (many copies)
MHGNTAEVQRLLEQQQPQQPADNDDDGNSNINSNNNADLVNAQDLYGWTPLLLASIHGHVQTVRFLLNKGADVNHENSFGNTAVMCAGKRGHFSVVRLLLFHGAKVSYQSFIISEQNLMTAAAAAATASRKHAKNEVQCGRGVNTNTNSMIRPHCPAGEEKKQQQPSSEQVDNSMLVPRLVEHMEMLIQKNPTMRKSLETFLHKHGREMKAIQTELLRKGLVKSVQLQKEIVSTNTAPPFRQQDEKQQQRQDTEIVHNLLETENRQGTGHDY